MSLLDAMDGEIEEEKPLSDKIDISSLQMIADEYFRFQKKYHGKWMISHWTDWHNVSVSRKLEFSITSQVIESFLKDHNKYDRLNVPSSICPFASMLIQNSYNQDHNDFNLPVLKDKLGNPITGAFQHLRGKKKIH